MSFSFPKVPVRSSLSRLLPLGAAILLGSLPSLAQAGVWLTSYSFAASHPPQVYTNDSMPSWYKLRVKVLNVPNSSHGFHAANAFNNNNAILDAVPPPGTYTAELYWLKYDSTGSSLVEIGPSSSVTIVVGEPDTTPPTVPTGLAVSSYGTSSVALVWNPSSDAGGVAAYEVFRNGSSAGTVYQPAMTVGGLTSGTSTHLQVRARDVAGNWSGLSTGVMANTLVDTVAPSQPGAPTASNVTPVSATVAWSAATDNVAVAGYEVFRNGTSLGRTSALNLALTGLSASTVYQVQVRAYDGSGNASVLSGQGSFTTPALDPTVPTVPTNLTIGTVTAVSVSLSWSPSTDNISVTGYEVFRNGVSAGIVTGTTTTIGGLNPQTVYSFAVRAKDGSNNWSTLSTPATAQTWVRRLGYTGFIYNGEWFNEDTQEYEYDPTSDVHDISLTQNGDIRVFTGGSTDMRGYLDNTGNYVSSGADGGNFLIATSLAAADHTATVSGEYPSTQGGYSLYVDFRGPNLNPIANIAGGAAVGRSPMVVSFDGSASSDPDGAVAGHAWDFDNNGSTDATGPTAVATLTNTGTAPQTRTIRLTVTDLAGATGFTTVDVIVHPASSYAIGVQNGSASAPYQQVGANVSLTAAAAPSGMQFSNWALISGNGTFGNANAANTTFTIGAADTVVQAVYVPDITPPTIPIGVAISELTADSFRVSWQPASDNMGVTAYEVYRNGTLATTATSATTVVTGLSPATVYQVTVRARDAAGNRSAHSQTALTKTWVRFYSASGTIYRDEYFNEETQQWEYTISTDEFYFSIPSGTVKVHCRGGSGLWGSVSTGLWSGNFNPNSLVTGNTTPGGAVSGHITSWTGGEDYQLFFDLDPAENIAPVALFSVTPALGRAPLQVSLDGSSAYDAEGPITGYAWDLDNNGTTDATGQRASQTFANAGSAPVSATVKLTVTDLDGATAFETKTVTVYPATSFSVQVNGGTTSAPFQQAGSAVNVVASPPPHGLQFSNWTLVSGSGTFGNASLAATTFSVGSADSVVQANYVPDTTAPGAPTGLWHSEVFADAANVQWSAASDNVGVVAYEVWVNGALHSVVNSPAVALQGLTAWTPYQVAVRARDAAGNLSAMSAALGVRTWQRLYSYSGWVTNGESYDEETQTYSYNPSYDWLPFSVPSAGTAKAYTRGNTDTKGDFGNVSSGTGGSPPNFLIQADVAAGNTGVGVYGEYQETAGPYSVFVDFCPTSSRTVAEFSATPTIGRSPLTVQLSGAKSSDWNGAITSYAWDFDDNGTTDATGQNASTTYTNNGASALTYTVRLTVVGPSGSAVATRTTTVYPASYSGITVEHGTVSQPYQQTGGSVTLTAVAPPSGGAFQGWVVVSGSGSFANASASTTSFTLGGGDTAIRANYGLDTSPPTAPANLAYSERTARTVTLGWSPASDNIGVTSYRVYRGATQIGTTPDLTFHDSGLTANTAYSYTVKAADGAGNLSSASNTLNVTTTQDFTADSDQDGIPNAVESALGSNGSSAGATDTTNQTQLNVQRPIK